MIHVAILGSTNGTSSQLLINRIKSNTLPGVELSLIISNRKHAGILKRAKQYNIKYIYLSGKGKEREEYDREIDKLLLEHRVDLVLLIGYMKFMSSWFVNKWINKVMNIHPSLLPAFSGKMDLDIHEEVLKRGCKVSGATLMFIDEGADTGPIISQRVVNIELSDTITTLKAKVQNLEKEMIVDGVEWWRDGKIHINGNQITID